MSKTDDIALNKPATQSSISRYSRGTAEEDARGANSETDFDDFAFHTEWEHNPWWQVDLLEEFIVEKIYLLNRNLCCAERLRHFSLLTSLDGEVWELIYQKADDDVFDDLPLILTGKCLARFIRVRLDGTNCLHFRRLRVFGRRPEADEGEVGSAPEFAGHEPGFAQDALKPGNHSLFVLSSEFISPLKIFCELHGLDEQIVRQSWGGQMLDIRGVSDRKFDGTINAIRLARRYGRFGNVFYQLLSSLIIARRLGCCELQIPQFDGGPTKLPVTVEGIKVTNWSDGAFVEPTLVGCLFAPVGLERFFWDFGARFASDTIHRYVRPLFGELLAGVEPLGRNVLAMHFRGGDIFTKPEGGHIHNLYVQPPASYYIAAFEYVQRHCGVDSACLVFEDRTNPALECVERELAKRNVPCALQSADLIADLRCLLGASHIVRPYGSFGQAAAILSQHCKTFFGFRDFSHTNLKHFPTSRVEELVRNNGARTVLIVDAGGRYMPPWCWNASDEQLDMVRNYPKDALEVKEIPALPYLNFE